ncbi:MAG TPA: hypothetical protein VLT13_11680 [Bacteroidota bacterium]|nr:hypothetical protein [Bacteroidota bacterium]
MPARISLLFAVTPLFLLCAGCTSTKVDSTPGRDGVRVTISQRARIELYDSLIPVPPDTVIAMYNECPPEEFHKRYKPLMEFVTALIDSFNQTIGSSYSIDTLHISHSIENFAEAGQSGKTLFISSSYFMLFNDQGILRSLLTHEFGHVRYRMLDSAATDLTARLWARLQETALFYLFRDGEYSGNAWFGGHPEDHPSELFASAYNLVHNRPEELRVRFTYVSNVHIPLLNEVIALVTP